MDWIPFIKEGLRGFLRKPFPVFGKTITVGISTGMDLDAIQILERSQRWLGSFWVRKIK
jgi:hypothetical protein